MHVIGTAGHVDHGKSTLVAALTGIHPDRLKEEQAREMTIELGFAWLTLPNQEEIGIVDVPGHRDFIENMLAGVGGIDAVLFVIAADEGVMPQTREHLAILDILQVNGGVIVLTKVDLVDDPEWLDLVEMDVRQMVRGTVLAEAPLVRVSARTRAGLDNLVQAIMDCLARNPPRMDLNRPRLPVDRVFTIAGFGTVVTGTLLDGKLHIGDDVEILPQGVRGRVRGLQTHRKKEEIAWPGSRTAVNITGVEVDQIRRGDLLTLPGLYQATRLLDAHFRLLSDVNGPLRHSSQVKFFVGAAEVLARVRLLGTEEIKPGEEGWLQLELAQPVVTVHGDHYILRRPSPGETLGGGEVIDPHPAKRHKRFSEDVLQGLEVLRKGSPVEVFYQASVASGPAPLREVVERSHLTPDKAQSALQELLSSRQLVLLGSGSSSSEDNALVIVQAEWAALTQKMFQELQAYHRVYPLRRGMLREELKSRMRIPARLFNSAVRQWVSECRLVENGLLVSLPTHQVQFSTLQQTQVNHLLNRFAQSPYTPPVVKECQAEVGEEVINALVEMGQLVQVSSEVVFRKQDYDDLVQILYDHFTKQDTLTVIQFRDRINTSRRYALAFLEYMDSIGVTKREGDFRRLNKAANKR